MFTKALLITFIQFYATQFNIDPKVAIAVAEVESAFKIDAIGGVGEVGLFQIRPEFSVVDEKELLNPIVNIIIGIRKLRKAKNECVHQVNLTWLICYNVGITGAKRIQYPELHPYVLKVRSKLNE